MKNLVSYISVILCIALIVLWQIFSDLKSYYLASIGVLVLSMIPVFLSFERSKPSAKQLALTASLIGIAVASRAVFYLVPQFKPIGAVVVLAGVCLGAKRGYLVGALSAFLSNFIFGQGMWTPFQMVGLGLVGFLAGLIFSKVKPRGITLAVVGFVLSFVVYSLVVDFNSVMMLATDYTIKSIVAIYVAGAPFNLTFGVCTFIFLLLLGEPFVNKTNRIIEKYGILEGENG